MRLLLAAGVAAVALFPASAQADSPRFSRACSGAVDHSCYYDFCGIVSCTRSDCVVFLDPGQGYNTGFCYGKARPQDPVES